MENVRHLASRWRGEGLTIGFTHGAFDLLHRGHVTFLTTASQQVDRLIVGVHIDEHVRAYKGLGRPILPLADRLAVVAALRCVAVACVVVETDGVEAIASIRPDVYVKDDQAHPRESAEGREAARIGTRVLAIRYSSDISTSKILKRVREGRP